MKKNDPIRRVREALARFSEDLLSHPDIHGLGIGYKERKGKETRTLAIVVHVSKKLPNKKNIDRDRLIPSELTFFSNEERIEVSVPVDVREALPPKPEVSCGSCATDLESRLRPVAGGFSIGRAGPGGGTLGGWVWDRVTEQIVLLSNEHVLGSTAGEAVIQPGYDDGGSFPADHFADVVRAGTFDASIAAAIDPDDVELEIECSGPAVYEIVDATLGMVVEKVGQTSGLTCGKVELIDYKFGSGYYGSQSDLWIDGDGSDFSKSADSGALYVEKTNPDGSRWKRIIGIHWGGSGNDGVGHPIRAVFNDLNLTTVCAGLIETLVESVFTRAEDSSWSHYPAPAYRRRKGPRFHVGIARDFENRIKDTPAGAMLLKVLRAHRADVVKVLMDGDGWRAAVAALKPVLAGKVTTDEILEHKFTAADIRNFDRVLSVASRIGPRTDPLVTIAEELLADAKDKRLKTILFEDQQTTHGRPTRKRKGNTQD
jgi:hypothetical protein